MKIFTVIPRASLLVLLLTLLNCDTVLAQSNVFARSFSQPKGLIEQALKDLQVNSGQKLPILEGFVGETSKPLENYERGFCQFSVDLLPGDGYGTVVTLKAKITAWFADRDVTKSGYQVLPSNGRLELDMLDRLEEKLTGKPVNSSPSGRTGTDTPAQNSIFPAFRGYLAPQFMIPRPLQMRWRSCEHSESRVKNASSS